MPTLLKELWVRMPLPEIEYYTLNELPKRWGVRKKRVKHLIETGKLACFACLKPGWMLKGVLLRQDRDQEEFHCLESLWFSGFVRLIPQDCHWIFREGEMRIARFICREEERNYLQYPADRSSRVRVKDMVVLTEEVRRFERIYLLKPPSDTALERPSSPGSTGVTPFVFSDDFETVSIRHESFRFGTVQARIVRQLYEASLTRQPWVHGKILLDKAGSRSERLKNVFQGKANWRHCIESDGRGYYRLNL